MIKHLKILILILFCASSAELLSATLQETLPQIRDGLVKSLNERGEVKAAALDFTDFRGRTNELGRYLSEMLSVELVTAEKVRVLDRANIDAIMQEHQLTAEGLVRAENAKKLGEFAGVDVILTGRIAQMDGQATLIVKAISTETAEVVAASTGKFELSPDMTRMMGMAVGRESMGSAGGSSSSSRSASGASVSAVDFIASKEFGSLVVKLRDIKTTKNGIIPVLNCAFEFENRDLENTAVLAVNAIPSNTGHHRRIIINMTARGGLSDSNGTSWISLDSNKFGLPLVGGFSLIHSEHGDHQFNAANDALSPLRRGRQFDPSGEVRTGQYWVGSFASVPPGGKRSIVLKFMPEPYSEYKPRHGFNDPRTPFPESFRFDLELIIGSIPAGEEPSKSKNLSVRSLAFDRVNLPDKR